MSKTFSAKWSAIFGRFKSFFRSFFTSDSLDKIVMTFYLKSHLLISSATSHPILRWSHHRSRHGDAPAPPMIIVFILVTSPVRARRAAPRLRPFRPSHEMDPQSAGRLQFLLAFVSGQRPKETLTTYRFPYFGLTADREFTIGHSDCAPRVL